MCHQHDERPLDTLERYWRAGEISEEQMLELRHFLTEREEQRLAEQQQQRATKSNQIFMDRLPRGMMEVFG